MASLVSDAVHVLVSVNNQYTTQRQQKGQAMRHSSKLVISICFCLLAFQSLAFIMVVPTNNLPARKVSPLLQSNAKSSGLEKTSTTQETLKLAEEEEPIKISLWLLPSPQGKAYHEVANVIERFSIRHPAASVPFAPHVTLIGGISCKNSAFLEDALIPKLREALRKAPSNVPCHFAAEPSFQPQWNQAAVLVMEQSEEFKNVVQICREIVCESLVVASCPKEEDRKPGDFKFPPPLKHPHLSLYYGIEGAPSKEEIVTSLGLRNNSSYSFEATQIAIWKTHPASTEGVAEWKELALFDLAES